MGDPARVAVANADVADPAALGRAVDVLVAQLGPVDVLVTSAGFSHPGLFLELEAGVFEQQMAVNYFGTLHTIRAVVPAMVERRRGHLVLVSSTVGFLGVYGFSAYAPAKFAVRGLAETLRGELKPHGIVVACRVPARHRHARAGGRERAQARRDRADLGVDQAAIGRGRRRRDRQGHRA